MTRPFPTSITRSALSVSANLAAAALLALFAGLPAGGAAAETIVAKVGGMTITEAELAHAEADLARQFANLPEDQLKGAVLSALIDMKLLANSATETGIADDEASKGRLAYLRSRELHNIYFERNIAETISDEAVKARYDKEIAAMEPVPEIRARHILVKTEDEAKAIIAELEAGKDFAELAKDKSTGPSAPGGGDLGFFSSGRMVPAFDKAAFALADGEFSKQPVETQFGWHVILRVESRTAPLPELAQVEGRLRQALLQEKYLSVVKEIRQSTPVEVLDEALKTQVEAMRK